MDMDKFGAIMLSMHKSEHDPKKSVSTFSTYADNLIHGADGDLLDTMFCATVVVYTEWLESMVKKFGFSDLEEFYNNYTWDDTDRWIDNAIEDEAIIGATVGNIDEIIKNRVVQG